MSLMRFNELNADQRREAINTEQRFNVWREVQARVRSSRGSMVWSETKGRAYLLRSSYTKQGVRRQMSLGAIYAYEAAAGVRLDAGLATEDVDLLLDSRGRLTLYATEDVQNASLLRILQHVDRSFERTRQDFRAVNRDGYLVDLIKPLRHPCWREDAARVGDDRDDLSAVAITGLAWHESAPAFEAVAIDERGEPLRIVTSDPRVFAAHKLWLSKQFDRAPIKRRRDRDQAEAVASIVASHMQHLPFEPNALLPIDLVNEAAPLFVAQP